MILSDIYNYLRSDENLKNLLGAEPQDSKIYPNFARISSKVPYIVYRSVNPGGGLEEVLDYEQAAFVITAESFGKTVEISARLTELLDLPQTKIPSAAHGIYYAKKSGGSDYADELGRHVRALNFIFKFKKY